MSILLVLSLSISLGRVLGVLTSSSVLWTWVQIHWDSVTGGDVVLRPSEYDGYIHSVLSSQPQVQEPIWFTEPPVLESEEMGVVFRTMM